MRVLAVHEDAIVFVSAFWQTTCTAVRAGGEGFLIDSPVLPDELETLPAVVEQAGFPVSALLATHADWDHLLGRLAFPEASLGCGSASAGRLAAEPGAAQRSLRDFDDEHYVERPGPLSLGTVQQLPVPGRLDLGPRQEIELLAADGHTVDGTAFWCAWLGLLVCGDYLSPVEIPMISPGGSLENYLATLERLQPLVRRAATVVPGHGHPLSGENAVRILEEDRAYLTALSSAVAPGGGGSSGDVPLPRGRTSRAQRRIHEENLAAAVTRPPGAPPPAV